MPTSFEASSLSVCRPRADFRGLLGRLKLQELDDARSRGVPKESRSRRLAYALQAVRANRTVSYRM